MKFASFVTNYLDLLQWPRLFSIDHDEFSPVLNTNPVEPRDPSRSAPVTSQQYTGIICKIIDEIEDFIVQNDEID